MYTHITHTHTHTFTIRNWLMHLWRLKSPRSATWKLGSQWHSFSPRPEAWEHQGNWENQFQSESKGKGRPMSSLKDSHNKFFLTQFFVLVRTLKEWGEDYPHWGKLLAFPSLPIQMLVSSRNTSTNRPRKIFNQISGYPVVQWRQYTKLTLTVA